MGIKNLLGIVVLAFLWGASFLITKIVVEEIHPITTSMLRCLFGSLSILFILLIQRQPLFPFFKHWKTFSKVGILGNALPFLFCSWGEVFINSSTAGVFDGTIPIFTLLFIYWFTPQEKLYPRQFYGVVLGFLGLLTIFSPELAKEGSMSFNGALLGKCFLLLMALCHAASFVYAKEKCSPFPSLQVVFMTLFFATLYLLPFSAFVELQNHSPFPSWEVSLGLFLLGTIGTGGGWYLYYSLLQKISAAQISLTTYLVPLFAIIIGIVLGGDEPSGIMFLGTAIIFVAMGMASSGSKTVCLEN